MMRVLPAMAIPLSRAIPAALGVRMSTAPKPVEAARPPRKPA